MKKSNTFLAVIFSLVFALSVFADGETNNPTRNDDPPADPMTATNSISSTSLTTVLDVIQQVLGLV